MVQIVKLLLFHFPVAKAYSDLSLFQKKNDVNPLRGFLVPLVQVCSFLLCPFCIIHLFLSLFIDYILQIRHCCVFLWRRMALLPPAHYFVVKVFEVNYLCLQAPVFISFFIALRKMAYLPVPSLQTGGLLWFPDLTAADPFYILPLTVTGTMFFILEVCHPSGRQFVACGAWLDMSH